MLDAVSKSFFHALARSKSLERLASRYGMSGRTGFARRFIAAFRAAGIKFAHKEVTVNVPP